MRSRIFGNKKFKSLFLITLSALFVLPAILNVVKFTTPALATTCTDTSKQYCYVVKMYKNQYASNIGATQSEVEYKTITVPTDSNNFSYKMSQSTGVSGRTVTVTASFELKNDNNTLDTYSQSSGQFYLGPTRYEIYASDGTTLLGSGSFTDTSGTERAFSINGSTEGTGTGEQPENQQTEATCHNTAGAVGWIVCPVLELAASATQWAYSTVIEPSLEVRTDLFQTSGDNNGTFQAWSTFRDIANIAFVILLLVVILSQVTGFGIDNYGIKKTLPNLIIAAILVNLSFIICQGAVDLSNIAGSGIYNLLNNIGNGITVGDLGLGGDIAYTTSIIFTVALAIGAGAVGVAVAGGFWTMISGALLAVIPAFISAAIAILFLFFMLAMRQAIVVMLVAIAPLAFVCYTLPNTKKLFSRWAELLRGMLLLYPICAVMIAGGRLASKIILSTGATEDNLFIILVAMVAEAGPLFLIPSLTRSAYRATGQLGTALNGLRGRWTAGAGRAVRGSRTYQNATARNERRRVTSGLARRRVNRFNEAQERLQNGSASYGGRYGRVRRARDYFTTRAGNAERVADINERVLAAEEQQRKIGRMTDATQVEGMRQQAAISANQQNVKNADYADATFANAVIQQAETEHDASRERQMLYNNAKYVQGKRNANDLALENELYSTRQNVNADFIEGKRQEARLGREGERARAGLYTNAGYVDSRRNQQQAVISGEITKMYADQFSRMSMGEIMSKLNDSVAGSSVENRNEQFTAAANALVQAGQADKVREIISGGKPEYAAAADSFGELVKNDKSFRDRAAQVLGSSGEFTFQEYAKHLGQSTVNSDGKSDAKSFKDWSNATDDKSLAASIQAKGLDKMDKDGFAYLAQHLNALKGATPDNIAKVAASTTDAATISKLADAVSKLDATARSNIMAATSGAQFVNMNESVRVAISGGGAAGDAAWKSAVGAALAADPQLRGKLNATEQGRYAGRPEETFSDGGGI